ncbi:MAG: hypothetical protein OXC72_09940 [Roseovarius sp.]|nr:hypothetical protein [Roseovarius sp.]
MKTMGCNPLIAMQIAFHGKAVYMLKSYCREKASKGEDSCEIRQTYPDFKPSPL